MLAIRAGTAVDFPNHDRVFHNVFSYRDGKKFDLGMYPAGTSKKIVFDKAGLSRIFCNIHPHMAAYVMAVDTPYFAVSDAQGGFAIANVPAGTYTMTVAGRGEIAGATCDFTVGSANLTINDCVISGHVREDIVPGLFCPAWTPPRPCCRCGERSSTSRQPRAISSRKISSFPT